MDSTKLWSPYNLNYLVAVKILCRWDWSSSSSRSGSDVDAFDDVNVKTLKKMENSPIKRFV
jgi:hypothetical protein